MAYPCHLKYAISIFICQINILSSRKYNKSLKINKLSLDKQIITEDKNII
jgi:hypothetical protein